MNCRFKFKFSDESVTKLINRVKQEIRNIQELRYYEAVEAITETQKATLVQTLKHIHKTHLGVIDVRSEVVKTEVPRTEYVFLVKGKEAVKLYFHGTENGMVYLTTETGYYDLAGKFKEQ